MCYFAESTLFIVVFFGIINGTTLSGLYIAVNLLVAQYFEQRRATACSLMFTAGGLNTIVFPPLIELFYSRYGIHAAFLLYGAILMNAFPCCIALRDPPWLDKHNFLSNRKRRTLDTVCTARSPVGGDTTSQDTNIAKCVESNDELHLFLDKRSVEKNVQRISLTNTNGTPTSSRFSMSSRLERNYVVDCFKHKLAPFATLSFLVSAVSFTVVNFGMALYVLLSTDLASDHGVEHSSSVYLLHAFSASDIVSRALSGVIIDSKILSLESVMLLGYLVQGAAFEMLAWFGTFHMMLAASALMGLTCGARIALQAPVIAKDFGLKKLPVVMGAIYFCIGVALLLRPPIVGYFRDRHGSYSGLLHSTAIVNGLMVVVWIIKLLNGRKQLLPTKAVQYSKEIRKEIGTELLELGRTAASDAGQ
nr:monocarboxylate transporter 12-like [Dermacentor andersoni]